jgi:hypothetical protein
MRAQYLPNIASGNGVPSFFWLLFMLCVCSSVFAQGPRVATNAAPPPAAWLLSGSLVLLCLALALHALRRERERRDA